MKKMFKRQEMKYLLNTQQKEKLLEMLKNVTVPDQYPDYSICSWYYDTDQLDFIRRSLDKPAYKEKLRLRSYGNVTSGKDLVFLEIKKKFEGTVYKRRVDFSYDQAVNYLRHPDGKDISRQEISRMLVKNHLKPKVYIRYDRQAFVWKADPEFRITLDSKIRYRLDDYRLADSSHDKPLLDDDTWILELKYVKNYPLEFVKILSAIGARPTSFSKVGQIFSKNAAILAGRASETRKETL